MDEKTPKSNFHIFRPLVSHSKIKAAGTVISGMLRVFRQVCYVSAELPLRRPSARLTRLRRLASVKVSRVAGLTLTNP